MKSSGCTLLILLIMSFSYYEALGVLLDSKFGTISSSAVLKTTYDSKVFAMPTESFNEIQNNPISNNELESEDDLIISFSPSLHFSSKLGLLKFSGSAGANIVQYLINDKKSYIVPTTSLSLDFDDTLALKKRISNNAKIRFETTFDIGQVVGASVLEQDLVAYSYINSGLNIRYNYSDKFGFGGGTSYSYRFYQTDRNSRTNQPNFDFSTLPLSARAFYIYSEKLDLFANYTFSRSKADSGNTLELTSSTSQSISLGLDGEVSSKLSGTASIGYSVVNYSNSFTPNQDNLITSLSLSWKHNSKTSSSANISRSFSPTSTGDSAFTTSLGYGLSHRFTESWSGNANINVGFTDFSTVTNNPHDSTSFGFGVDTSIVLSKHFTLGGGYNVTHSDSSQSGDFIKHVLYSQLSGRF